MNPKHFYVADFSDRVKSDFNPSICVPPIDLDEENKSFTALVYAQDPITYDIRSDIGFMMSSADEGFKQYVREHLLSPTPVGALADTSDEAESLVRKNLMTSEQFYSYARDYVANLQKDE